MNVYKINSDIIRDDELVVAENITKAIELYCGRYSDEFMSDKNITKIERIGEKCLISDK